MKVYCHVYTPIGKIGLGRILLLGLLTACVHVQLGK